MLGLGSQNRPITIEDDDDDTPDLETKLQQQRNRQILDQALMTNSPFEICFAVVKTAIPGSLKAKEHQLNKAILDYYQQRIGIKISHEYFRPRPEVDLGDNSIEPNPQAFLLYGCDFLTTRNIIARFSMLGVPIHSIKWINQSICKVVFKNSEAASSLFQKMRPHMKIEEESAELPKDWIPIKSYYVHVFQRKLWIRYANSKDEQMQKEEVDKNKEFEEAYRELPKVLLIKFRAENKYRQVIQQIKRQNEIKRMIRLKNSNHRDRDRGEGRERTRQKGRRPGYSHHERQLRDERRQDHRDNRFNRQRRNDRVQDLNMSFKYQDRLARQADEDQDLSFFMQGPKNNQTQNLSYEINQSKNMSSRINRQDTSFSKVYYDAARAEAGECDSELSFNMPPISERVLNPYEESVILGEGRQSPSHSHADFFLDEEISRSLVVEKGKAEGMANCSFAINWQRPNNAVSGEKMQAEKQDDDLSFVISGKKKPDVEVNLDPASYSY